MSLLLALTNSSAAQPNRLWTFRSAATVAISLLSAEEISTSRAATLNDFRHTSVSANGMVAHPINQVVLVNGEDAIVHVDHARKLQPFRQYVVVAPPTVGAPWHLWDRRQIRLDDEPIEPLKPVTLAPYRAPQYELATATYTVDVPAIGDIEWTREDIRYPKVDFGFFRRTAVAVQPGQPFFSWKRTLAAPEAEDYTIPPTSLFALKRITVETVAPPVVETTVRGAGKSKSKRRYIVEIDGQEFEVSSVDEALALLAEAKALAKQVATEARQATVVKPGLRIPQIRTPDKELVPVIQKARAEIKDIYAELKRDLEIRFLIARADEAEEEEAIIRLLM